jgi:hypothetical protein
MDCIFCNIPLSKLHVDTNDYYCVKCPYNYIRYDQINGLGYQYWNFYVGEYYVWVRLYNDENAISHVCHADVYRDNVCNIATAIRPCTREKLKLFILFS